MQRSRGYLPLDDPRWADLAHAYGPARDLPALLRKAAQDFRPGHVEDSSWFALWSALCHQGDTYTASYAAVPHLVAMITGHLARKQYDPLYLAASIELARLERRGPEIPADLAASYRKAVAEGRALADAALPTAWDPDSAAAIRASAAALRGNAREARQILETEDSDS